MCTVAFGVGAKSVMLKLGELEVRNMSVNVCLSVVCKPCDNQQPLQAKILRSLR